MTHIKTERLRENNIQIRLTFFGYEGDIHDIVKKLPSPNKAYNKGERFPERSLPKSSLITYLTSSTEWEDSLGKHWSGLQKRLSGYEHVLETLSSDCERTVCTIVVDYVGRFPDLILPTGLIHFLSDLSASLEIDVLDDQ